MRHILTLNAGSSSIKFALFQAQDGGAAEAAQALLRGQVEGLGATPRLQARDGAGASLADRSFAPKDMADHEAAVGAILELLEATWPGAVISTPPCTMRWPTASMAILPIAASR